MTVSKALSLSETDRAIWRLRIENESMPITECGCWIWLGCVHHNGYGIVICRKWQQRNIAIHRISYAAFKGDIPAGLFVMHSCDTPLCVNPDHLSLGTCADNLRDMSRKGRRIGMPPKRLTSDTARECLTSNESIRTLAAKFGVSPSTVSAIRQRRIWKWLQP